MLEARLLAALSLALLLAASALLVWRWGHSRQAHQAARQLLDRRIRTSLEAPAAVPVHGGGEESAGSMAQRLGSNPWMAAPALTDVNASADEGANPAVAKPGWMPGRLQGVVQGRTLVWGVAAWLLFVAAVAAFAGVIGLGAALLLGLLLGPFLVWLRLQKFRRQLVRQLPAFIDAMVRLITIGNSTQASFQLAIATTQPPLHDRLERAASLVRAGVDLDRALHQVASQVRVEEMFLLSSILGLGVRYGGRADLLLERVADFMRDHESAEAELSAMSSETRLSAWVLGLLPVVVGAFIILLNPQYFARMWLDATGQWMIFGAVALQLLGAGLLYRLARLA